MRTTTVAIAILGLASAAAAIPVPLPVNDGFEDYGDGTVISSLGSQGWGASAPSFVVQTMQVHAGSNAAILPEAGTMSNTVSSADGKVWADFYMLPQFGAQPSIPTGSTVAVRLCVDLNGVLNMMSDGAWQEVATDAFGAPIPALTATNWVRLSIFHDYTQGKAALFIDGRLVRQNVAFVKATASNMNALTFIQRGGVSYLDSVSISASPPASLTADDDHEGTPDAVQIHNNGAVSAVRYSTLPFVESFETYADGAELSSLPQRGWAATHPDVKVQTSIVYAGGKAAMLPPAFRAASNFVQSAGAGIVWTDLRLKPVLGALPADPASAVTSVRVAFTTNGHVAVESAAGWVEYASTLVHTPAPVQSNQWARITVALNYPRRWAAVFQDGKLLCDRLSFIGANATAYGQFKTRNDDGAGSACLDDLSIGTTFPPDLTEDLDQDGAADAWEVHGFNSIFGWPPGTVCIIR